MINSKEVGPPHTNFLKAVSINDRLNHFLARRNLQSHQSKIEKIRKREIRSNAPLKPTIQSCQTSSSNFKKPMIKFSGSIRNNSLKYRKEDGLSKRKTIEKSSPRPFNRISHQGIMKNRLNQMKFIGEKHTPQDEFKSV